ncbi:MAG: sensor histidine kinase [Atopobiaceae bacterium]|jgi:signal transduction histidine kinase|nr:sensor histidine kinase [Atopobiaceae bacterium]MCI2173722.1 sensor histidine kinase [Atopobiaceae bacterium]MCI2207636.1 sensor histidine kinase [Atopobiaceae bacterium]
MALLRYLRDHVASLALFAVAVLIVNVVLRGANAVPGIAELVTFVLVLSECLKVAVDFGRQRAFWREMSEVASGAEGSSLDAADIVAEPSFTTGRVAWEALDSVSREAHDEVARAGRDNEEYRAYVEAWVHEVKTPIAAAHLVVDNHPGQDSAAIAVELDRIDGYVEQALYFARSSSLDRDYAIREVGLRALVGDVVKSRARSLIENGMHISMGELDETVLTDAKWTRFILGQLVDNAVKYRVSPDEGRDPSISFTCRREREGHADERVVLSVTDDGRGIPVRDVGRVFDKGFVGENGRRSDQGKSTGLGLWLVRRLCDKMGLGVSVSSVEGISTTVELAFPANRMHYLAD